MWSTIIAWDGRQHIVKLRRDAELVAEIPLDTWVKLSAVEYVISEELASAGYERQWRQSHSATEDEPDLE